ncbi:ecdysteroid-regulated 16 kDa protein-like isoform X2 [Pararge aegeria]|uniref:ecdysteroid-regulated 16 kDa protein-like isoform X2 n=1 Tax=Pararge aegeria TaxID=116150 RepID=UPI0019D1448C|nr:ecdysteroid-regulated 16 kDa protein-like isoform X2 [Pararge aegeria]
MGWSTHPLLTTCSINCQNFEGLSDRIQVLPCESKRCKLRKNSNTTVILKFQTKTEVKELTNNVFANLGGLPLPFIGVSGMSACPHVKRADNGQPAPCPLAANVEYVYTNQFPIESFYPQVPLRVHWALNDGQKDVICFEVPAIITKR